MTLCSPWFVMRRRRTYGTLKIHRRKRVEGTLQSFNPVDILTPNFTQFWCFSLARLSCEEWMIFSKMRNCFVDHFKNLLVYSFLYLITLSLSIYQLEQSWCWLDWIIWWRNWLQNRIRMEKWKSLWQLLKSWETWTERLSPSNFI